MTSAGGDGAAGTAGPLARGMGDGEDARVRRGRPWRAALRCWTVHAVRPVVPAQPGRRADGRGLARIRRVEGKEVPDAMPDELTIAVDGGFPVTSVRLAGNLGLAGAAKLRTTLNKILADEPSAVVIDVADIVVVDDLSVLVFATAR